MSTACCTSVRQSVRIWAASSLGIPRKKVGTALVMARAITNSGRSLTGRQSGTLKEQIDSKQECESERISPASIKRRSEPSIEAKLEEVERHESRMGTGDAGGSRGGDR